MRDLVDQLISQDSSNESNILQSSISLFASFKQKFQKCSSFNKGQTLFELGGVFAKVLKYYADRLGSNLPRLDKPVKLQP